MIVLGIETSCDETGIALYDGGGKGLIAQALYSQIDLHADYGGVVPELASRDHVRKTLPLVSQVIDMAEISKSDIAGVAYTRGPGLMGALLVGATIGRSLAMACGVPAIGVHHMEGHLLAPMLEETPPDFPFVALLVSGGHTQLVKVDGIGSYEILGESLDDAAGEAFDKAAKMLGLDYPGGPMVARMAMRGVPGRYQFPRPMVDRPGLDFSFSGLKTYCLNTIQSELKSIGVNPAVGSLRGDALDEQTKCNIAWAFQEAVVDTLVIKCRRALEYTGLSRLVMAGGVSANLLLRQRLEISLRKAGGQVFYARPEFCTDNGAMIAYAGYRRLSAGQKDDLALTVKPRWPLDQLAPI